MDQTTSADIKHYYERDYYLAKMAGHTEFGSGRADLQTLPDIRRAYALMLQPEVGAATDIGAGRGELARHLLERGARVTLVDYAEAAIEIAREHVGEQEGAEFVVADAAELSRHVAPNSQDAVFMTDVVEHISSPELRPIFAQCHEVLGPGGVLAVHTPEKHYGTVMTQDAVQGYHINIFDIVDLRALLSETFSWVDAFTWNGTERFSSRGKSIELFALARDDGPYPVRSLDLVEHRIVPEGGAGWRSATLTENPKLPPRFLLRFDLNVIAAPEDANVQVIFETSDPETYFWTAFATKSLQEDPADIFIASELVNPVGDAEWSDVERIVLRSRSPQGEPRDLRVSDLRLVHA